MRETLAAAAVLFISTAAASVAADLAPAYTKAPPAAVYGWTGFYIGGNIGGGVASSRLVTLALPTDRMLTAAEPVGEVLSVRALSSR
jgi:opacity protein-like surface antigen